MDCGRYRDVPIPSPTHPCLYPPSILCHSQPALTRTGLQPKGRGGKRGTSAWNSVFSLIESPWEYKHKRLGTLLSRVHLHNTYTLSRSIWAIGDKTAGVECVYICDLCVCTVYDVRVQDFDWSLASYTMKH